MTMHGDPIVEASKSPQNTSSKTWIYVLVALLLLGAIGWFVWSRKAAAAAAASAAAPTDRVVPVLLAPVVKKDFPISSRAAWGRSTSSS